MLRFGIVSQINPITVQARVSFEDDESTSFWLPVLQTKILKDRLIISYPSNADILLTFPNNTSIRSNQTGR